MPVKTKAELRSYYKSLRKGFSPEYKSRLDKKITDNFLSLNEYKNCDILLAFVPKEIEVNTDKIISKAFCDGKIVAAPRCGSYGNTMDFYVINGKLYFGEMTFFSGAGFSRYKPREFEFEMGKKLKLPER